MVMETSTPLSGRLAMRRFTRHRRSKILPRSSLPKSRREKKTDGTLVVVCAPQLGKSAPGVPNPAVWYGTLPDGPAFKIEQVSMNNLYHAPSQLIEHPDFRNERPGVMVGYAGHVPRARDKVGGSPLGHLPGTPVSPNGKVGIDMEAMMSGRFERILPADRYKTFAQMPTTDSYTSEMRDEFGQSGNATLGQKDFLGKGGIKPKLYVGEDRGPATTDGIIPGYGGHKQGAKFSYGSSIYSNAIPKGNSKLDNWSGKNFASTGHGASSLANFEDDVGLNTSGDVPVTNSGSI